MSRVEASGITDFALELPITFEQGVAGMTRAVSREEVRFTTCAALVAEQRLTGILRIPAGADAVGTALRFVARVTRVLPGAGDDGAVEVRARFERLDFVLEGAA